MKRPQLPAGDLLFCPSPKCHQPLYAMRATDGRLLAVCTACKFSVEPPAQDAPRPTSEANAWAGPP